MDEVSFFTLYACMSSSIQMKYESLGLFKTVKNVIAWFGSSRTITLAVYKLALAAQRMLSLKKHNFAYVFFFSVDWYRICWRRDSRELRLIWLLIRIYVRIWWWAEHAVMIMTNELNARLSSFGQKMICNREVKCYGLSNDGFWFGGVHIFVYMCSVLCTVCKLSKNLRRALGPLDNKISHRSDMKLQQKL